VAALDARARGEGSSRRRAEQEAAQQVLERITSDEVTAHD
jgi:dsRNA-specific ribonuclease